MVMSPVLKQPEQPGITLRAVQVLPPSYDTRRGPLVNPVGVTIKGDVTIVRGFVGSIARKGSVLLKFSSLMVAGMASTTTICPAVESVNVHATTASSVNNKRLRFKNPIFSSPYSHPEVWLETCRFIESPSTGAVPCPGLPLEQRQICPPRNTLSSHVPCPDQGEAGR